MAPVAAADSGAAPAEAAKEEESVESCDEGYCNLGLFDSAY